MKWSLDTLQPLIIARKKDNGRGKPTKPGPSVSASHAPTREIPTFSTLQSFIEFPLRIIGFFSITFSCSQILRQAFLRRENP